MTGIVLLAAGASTRMGSPKQTLVFKGVSLLQHAVQTALASSCSPVIVVLGANYSQTEAELKDLPVQIVYNKAWEEGMASSIREGINALQNIAPNIDQAILMVCDQPYVSPALLEQLIETQAKEQKGIVACAYKDTLGTPAIFHRSHFSELMSLQGQQGAKKMLMKGSEYVAVLPFPEGNIDIDTPADYEALTASSR